MRCRTSKTSAKTAKADVLAGTTDFEIASLAVQIAGLGYRSNVPINCIKPAIDLLLSVRAERRRINPQKIDKYLCWLQYKHTFPSDAKYMDADVARREILKGKNPTHWNPRLTDYINQNLRLRYAFEVNKRVRVDELYLIKEDFFERWAVERRKTAARSSANKPRISGIGRTR